MTFFAFAYIALIFQSLGPLSKCLKGWLQLRWASNADPEVALKMVACTNTNVYPMGPQPNVPTEQVDAETHNSDKERQSKVDSSVAFEPQVLKDSMFSPALKLAIQGTVSSSVTEGRFSGGLSSHSQLGFPSLTQRLLWAWVFLWKKRLADKIWHGHACTIRRRIAPNSSRKNSPPKIWHQGACTIRRRIAPNSSRKTRRQALVCFDCNELSGFQRHACHFQYSCARWGSCPAGKNAQFNCPGLQAVGNQQQASQKSDSSKK